MRFQGDQQISIATHSITEGQPFDLLPLQASSSARILAKAGSTPAVIQMPLGKGLVTVFASPFGLGAESAVKGDHRSGGKQTAAQSLSDSAARPGNSRSGV